MVAPLKLEAGSVKGLPGENQMRTLAVSEPVFYKRQVTVGIAAVHFVADNRMSKVSEMDAKLVLAASERAQAQQSKTCIRKAFLDDVFSLRGCAIGTDAVFDGHFAGFIAAKRGVNDALRRGDVTVNDGEIFFGHGAGFQELAEFAGGNRISRQQNYAGGFAVKPVDEIRGGSFTIQIKPRTTDEAGIFVALGGMTNEAGGLIDDEEVSVLVDDGEQIFQAGTGLTGGRHELHELNVFNHHVKLPSLFLTVPLSG